MSQTSRREFLKQAGAVGLAMGAVSVAGPQSLHAAADASRPNILLFFPDQHRYDWLGTTRGLGLRTPNLDVLGTRGVRFTKAVCPAPVCAPSRACLAAGKEYDRCGVAGNGQNYPERQTTFYKLLRQSGYHVMGCGKFDLRKPSFSWGRDGKQVIDGVSYMDLWGFSDGIDNSGKHDGIAAFKRGKFCPYTGFLQDRELLQVHVDDFARRKNYDGNVTPLPEDAYADNWIGNNGLQLIRSAPPGKPWFLQVSFNGPHEPMDVTRRMKDGWKGVRFPAPNGGPPTIDHDEIRQNYAAMIENIDRWLGVYVRELERRGELDRTLIVYSSDHGEMLGDHGRWGKTLPYHPSAGVPLIVAGPGLRQGWVCEAPATTLDLSATFLELVGANVPKDMDSRSLLPLLRGQTDSHRQVVRSGLGRWRLAWDGRYKLIRGFDGQGRAGGRERSDVLFDLQDDPLENTNIVQKAREIVRRLEVEL